MFVQFQIFSTQWHEDFTSKMQGIPCMLLANKVNTISLFANEMGFLMFFLLYFRKKCDLPGVDLNQYDINGFVEKHGLIGWYKTSALNGENIGNYSIEKYNFFFALI